MTSADLPTGDDGERLVQDAARANLYAIIGRFFYDAPDASLLAAVTQGAGDEEAEDGPIGAAWRELRDACRSASLPELEEEFETLFVGVGKSEVTPYTSHYVRGSAPARHLVRLRELLAQWRLGRRGAASETEDHVSGICDVMRLLLSEDYPFDEQKLFFKEFLYEGMIPFCDAIDRSPNAAFFRCVAQFTRAFLDIEKSAFEMPND